MAKIGPYIIRLLFIIIKTVLSFKKIDKSTMKDVF